MFNTKITKREFQSIITEMSEVDFNRLLFCQEIAGTYLAVSKFESTLVSAMFMCDRVKLQTKLGPDQTRWDGATAKKALLEGSTLGSLIKILERHHIDPSDLSYLRWIKGKRDHFVHRLFHEGGWPGELDSKGCYWMRRRLLAIQRWLERGERNIWLIFERAGFVELDHFSDGGILAMNTGLRDLIQEDVAKMALSDRMSE